MNTQLKKKLKEKISDFAYNEGLSDVRFTDPKVDFAEFNRFKEFIQKGYHGQMDWLNNNISWRGNPKLMWRDVKTVIVLAENYYKGGDPLAGLKKKDKANISIYARGDDYHNILKKKLKKVASHLIRIVDNSEVKVFVDTAPIMEKHLAQKAGIGWQGKHTNILSKKLGNWIFLGLIFTNIKFDIDEPEKDHCGNCNRCINICPTNAFVAPYKLDATKCISYLTIEHKGPVDLKLRSYLGNRIFGCDDCLAICPWNKFSKKSQELKYSDRIIDNLDLNELAQLDENQFKKLFRKSPIKRIGRNRFVRNILYAIGNSGDIKFKKTLFLLTNDYDPTVAEAALWALNEINANVNE